MEEDRAFGSVWYSPHALSTDTPPARGRRRSPAIAALLSFLIPGLGQLYSGRRRLAVIFVVPAALVLVLLLLQFRQGFLWFGARLVDPNYALAVLAVVVLFGGWRLLAVVQAFFTGESRPERRKLDRTFLTILVAVIFVSHLGASFLLAVDYQAASNAFQPERPGLVDLSTPHATATPTLAPGQTAAPTDPATPSPSPVISSRVTILFNGVDTSTGAGRGGQTLYDSNLVVSYDPDNNTLTMISVPRDAVMMPFYFKLVGSKVKLNAIPSYVKSGFIPSPDAPYTTLLKEISYLVGVPIKYYAVMDFNGFVKMIDTVGGIDVNNQAAIDDPTYSWLDGHYGFSLPAGQQHLNGRNALAYVRSRHSSGDNDFGRSGRQQEVMLDLMRKMAQPDQLLNLPSLMSTLGSSVTTNFPADKVADYITIGQNIPKQNITQVVLDPSDGYSHYYTIPGGGASSGVCLFNAKLAQLSIQLFDKDSTWNGKAIPPQNC